MDPTEALANFLIACEDKNRIEAEEYLEYLYDWVAQGGHLPNIYEAIDKLKRA